LNIGGTISTTSIDASANGNTVNYTGGAQSVRGINYVNLGLSGNGVKTLTTNTTAISGNLALSNGASAATVIPVAIGGNLSVGDGCSYTINHTDITISGTTTVGGAGSVGTSPIGTFGGNPLYTIIGNTAPSPTSINQIPLFSNLPVTSPTSGIGFQNSSNNIRIDAILTMAESRGLLKILSRPRVVTQNNIQALIRQGVRVPIVTQAQLGGPPTVTYVDAFLRLTVVPQITSEGTIFLNVDVENTTPDFGRTIQGNPTLITQQATTQVLVTDGGTVVIGGVIQTQNSVNISQVPLLGNIPALGNLFKHKQVSTSNQELIFFITPRIIQT